MSKSKSRVHVMVSGRVQGVFFRSFTRDHASSSGIKGWVRNTRDGKVEVVAEGDEGKLREFIDKIGEGPRGAIVRKVDVEWEEYKGEFENFTIRR